MIRFFDFSRYHGKQPQGSTFIRVEQVIKYWPEAAKYKYGEKPEVMIFQKVYCTQDYKIPAHLEAIKILDICDPDWLEGASIKETIDTVDAVTVPTEALAKFLSQLTEKPIKIIPDRFDIACLEKPKQHYNTAKKVVWFGYHHNAVVLTPALELIKELGLELIIISNDDPLYITKELKHKFIKYTEDSFYKDIQEADFALFPQGFRPQDRFKSNNKEVKAILAGLPVAKDAEGMRKYMEPKARQQFIDKQYDTIKSDYDVRKSVEQYKELINELSPIRHPE